MRDTISSEVKCILEMKNSCRYRIQKNNLRKEKMYQNGIKLKKELESADEIQDRNNVNQISADSKVKEQLDLIESSIPSSALEIALSEEVLRKDTYIKRLSGEVMKLKAFICKSRQTYKRKRKDEKAPTRALSAYNIFVQDKFSRLTKENEAALRSTDIQAHMKRVLPASLVASTGNQWKELTLEEKAYYEERAKADRERYDFQMSKYQPPDKQLNRKRNKTGYNMFFSSHVLSLKQSETGVPSERGSVARLVGNAWKDLSAEDKRFYEREADKHNDLDSGEENEVLKKRQGYRKHSECPHGASICDDHIHTLPTGIHPHTGHTSVADRPHRDLLNQYTSYHNVLPLLYSACPVYYDYKNRPPHPPSVVLASNNEQNHGVYYYPPAHYPPYPDPS